LTPDFFPPLFLFLRDFRQFQKKITFDKKSNLKNIERAKFAKKLSILFNFILALKRFGRIDFKNFSKEIIFFTLPIEPFFSSLNFFTCIFFLAITLRKSDLNKLSSTPEFFREICKKKIHKKILASFYALSSPKIMESLQVKSFVL